MIKGRYGNTSGRPFFSGVLSIPSLAVSGPISFLLDTGADRTVLMPADAARLGVDHNLIVERAISHGVGGKSNDYVVEAVASFTDPGMMAYGWLIKLRVMAPHAAIAQAPSLLGRDIIKHWRLVYEPSAAILEAEVRYADGQKDLRAIS